MSVLAKDPSAVLDYSLDYNDTADPYLESGETIATSTWAVAPTGELTIDADSNTTTTTTVTVSAGTAGNVYRLTNTLTTSASRTEERSIILRVQERLSTGCVSGVSNTACPPWRNYSQDFNARLVGELERLPGDSALVVAMLDYTALRDQLRVCQRE